MQVVCWLFFGQEGAEWNKIVIIKLSAHLMFYMLYFGLSAINFNTLRMATLIIFF